MFEETIKYLKELKEQINSQNDEMTKEDKMILIIEDAILNSERRYGSIIFEYVNGKYIGSHIQRHKYGWTFQNQVIDISYVISTCQSKGIECVLKQDIVGTANNAYSLNFGVTIEKPLSYPKKKLALS